MNNTRHLKEAFYSPYPGLRPFKREESSLFFGREDQIEDMLAKLETNRFMTVVGTSGCGKSSLVRAGLLPTLGEGLLSDAGPEWRITVMRPGNSPFERLAFGLIEDSALGKERGCDARSAAFLLATLRRGPLGLVDAIRETHLPPGTNVLVVVDQFEEIFRYREQARNVNDADAFVNLLLNSTPQSWNIQTAQQKVPIYIVITMRSDFIGDCALFTGLPERISDTQFLTPRLSRSQYNSAIVDPARAFGGDLEPDLTNRLLNDLRGSPHQLPVLQHALMRMWTRANDDDDSSDKRLTLADYEAVGGLSKALSNHADECLQDLDEAQQSITETMFRCLCERSSDQRDTRRPAKLSEVAEVAGVTTDAVKAVVEVFRLPDRSFIMPPVPTQLETDTILDISHESLISRWQNLNQWVAAEVDSAEIYTRLEQDARTWNQLKRQRGSLRRSPYLDMTLSWQRIEKPTGIWARRYGGDFELAMKFLKASEEEHKREKQEKDAARQRELEHERDLAEAQARTEEQKTRAEEKAKSARRLKISTLAALIMFVIAIVFAIFAVRESERATEAKDEAVKQTKIAEDQKKLAEDQRKHARRLAASYYVNQSKNKLSSHPELSLLLAVESFSIISIPDARRALLQALTEIGGFPLRGHNAAVLAVTFSPDGGSLVSASRDNIVNKWDISKILAGSWGMSKVPTESWDLSELPAESWNPSKIPTDSYSPRGRLSTGATLSLSPDGKVLASLGKPPKDRKDEEIHIRIWDLTNPRTEPLLLNPPYRRSMVASTAFSPDGKVFALGGRYGTIRIWDLATPAEPRELKPAGRKSAVSAIAINRGAKVLAAVSRYDTSIHLWDLANHEAEPYLLKGDGRRSGAKTIAFSPDGKVLASGGRYGTIRLWDLATRTETRKLKLAEFRRDVTILAFSQDGNALACGSSDSKIGIWDLSDTDNESNPRLLRGHEGAIATLVFSPDGNILASGSWDKTIRLWHLTNPTAEPRLVYGDPDEITAMVYSPADKTVASVNDDNTIRLWNLSAPNAASRDLKGHKEKITAVSISRDGNTFAAGSEDKTIYLWDLSKSQEELQILPGHEEKITALAFSSNGKTLAVASEDKPIRLLDLSQSEAEPQILPGNEEKVTALAFSSIGETLAVASEDKPIRLLDLSQSEGEPQTLPSNEEKVTALAFSSDDEILAVASENKTIRLWNLLNSEEKEIVLKGNENDVFTVAFSSDDSFLMSGDNSNTISRWDLQTDTLKQIACRYAGRNFSYAEWKEHGLNRPYHLTCKKFSVHSSFIEEGRKLAKAGNLEAAKATFSEAKEADSGLTLDPKSETRRFAAVGLVEKGKRLAKQGKVDEAIAAFVDAREFDSSLELDPKSEVRQLAVPALVRKGERLAKQIKIEEAVAAFSEAKQLDPSLKLDPKSEVRQLAVPALVRKAEGFAKQIKIEEAVAAFSKVKQLDPGLNLDPEPEARWIAVQVLVSKGKRLISQGKLDDAIAAFSEAREHDPALDLDPESEARRFMAQGLIIKGKRLARQDKVDEAIATFSEAREQDPGLDLDPKLEARRFAVQGLIDKGRRLARQGMIEKAIATFSEARERDSSLDVDPKLEAQRSAVQGLVDKGKRLAEQGKVDKAIVVFSEARERDASSDIDPQIEARRFAALGRIKTGKRRDDIKAALEDFSEAQKLDPTIVLSAYDYNSLCWNGSLWEFASEVMDYCNQAVDLKSDYGGYHDSRGVARALTENYAGAIEDFQYYVQWGLESRSLLDKVLKRKHWIRELEANRNPFDSDMLKGLRKK